VTTDLNTLLTALYVKVDDEIGGTRCIGRPPLLSDSELVCPAVAQAMLGFRSEARWLPYANEHLSGMFSYLPQRAAYNKRLRAALPPLWSATRGRPVQPCVRKATWQTSPPTACRAGVPGAGPATSVQAVQDLPPVLDCPAEGLAHLGSQQPGQG
jgi:hypothetical protein